MVAYSQQQQDVCQGVICSPARAGEGPALHVGSPGMAVPRFPPIQHPHSTQAPAPGTGKGCTVAPPRARQACEDSRATEKSEAPRG